MDNILSDSGCCGRVVAFVVSCPPIIEGAWLMASVVGTCSLEAVVLVVVVVVVWLWLWLCISDSWA